MTRPFLTATWNNLVMANYEMDPAALKQYVPAGTEIDLYNGKCFVSLVGFMFMKTRILSMKMPFHTNFPEVNLRFYVTNNVNGYVKRGVVFIKEIVPKPAISIIANTIYREKYCCLLMRNSLSADGDMIKVRYEWRYRRHWNYIAADASCIPQPIIPGSEVEFIAEHYWGFSKHNASVTYEYEVQHERWQVYPVQHYKIDCDFEQMYGPAFSMLTQSQPNSIFMAKGSAVSVYRKGLLTQVS